MKPYRGSAAGARNYLEADRSRADDYYLAEGAGVAERFVASPEAGVRVMAPLSGDDYAAWVAGVDPDTGVAKGRLRQDANAVRFVEVIVNGPKSWSLAAALHPDVSAALDGAQDRAAVQVIGWLAQHATTRVGPRGGQVQIPVSQIEAAVIRHYTSRAGDPHRHLHLQINARVHAGGAWRGLHTVGVRDSLGAINGIGHAAVMTDPQFRTTLAAHGYTLNEAGEITQLAPHVGAFSRRATQIAASIDRYQQEWTAAHPGQQPGPALRRVWDAGAWAEDRPDKVIPRSPAELHERWLRELATLGYHDHDRPARLVPTAVGRLNRDHAAEIVLTRLGAARSAWNTADIRGEVEQLITRTGIVTDAAIRLELAEDLTARALERCVPLLDANDQARAVPEHIRALTSRHVLEVEADLTTRFTARANTATAALESKVAAARDRSADTSPHTSRGEALDRCQAAAVTALTGSLELVVVEGAAGAGKTSVLTASRVELAEQGRRLVVVTPTLKAAQIATRETGATSGSAARLVFQHGWRWDHDGAWTRLQSGDLDPVTGGRYTGPQPDVALQRGDVLVIDEAGMADQDTACALLTIADERGARVALLGDRRQLTAIGRGGVLDLAARWVAPEARVDLGEVHRFTRQRDTTSGLTVTVPDVEYAQLSLAMRTGDDPAAVFDALLERGQIALHPTPAAQVAVVADAYVTDQDSQSGADRGVAVVADTREQVDELNTAIRDRLVAAVRVDDTHTTTTVAGVRIGIGDRVATRRNDQHLGVANRDTWTVTGIDSDGAVTVLGDDRRQRTLPPGYVAQHVELAYASTVYGVQGDTVTAGHLVAGEHTGAAAAYVGMTRGRHANTAHLVADSIDDARNAWVEVFAHDRADLGPSHAREDAAREAANYAPTRPVDDVLAELRRAWTVQQRNRERLADTVPVRDALREIIPLLQAHDEQLAAAQERCQQAGDAAAAAADRVTASSAALTQQARQLHDELQQAWDADIGQAQTAARTVLDGPGRLGLRLRSVNRGVEQLGAWSTTWQPYLPDMPTDTHAIAHYAQRAENPARLDTAFADYAHTHITRTHPEHADLVTAAATAAEQQSHAWQQMRDTRPAHTQQLARYGRLAYTENPEQRLHELEHTVTTLQAHLVAAGTAIEHLTSDPATASLPAGQLERHHDEWRAGYVADRAAAREQALRAAYEAADRDRGLTRLARSREQHQRHVTPVRDRGPSLGR